MADSREALKEKRDRLRQLRAENATKQLKTAEDADTKLIEAEAKRIDQDIAYEEWAASILDGSAKADTPPDNSAFAGQTAPPNNAVPNQPPLNTGDDDDDENEV